MLKTSLPPNIFKLADYPEIDSNAVDQPIPIGWGRLTSITPACVNVKTGRYKVLDSAFQSLQEITEVRSGSDVLVEDDDYTVDLAQAEFTLGGMPFVEAGGVYYFDIRSNYPIDGAHFMKLPCGGTYADGQAYTINGSGVWTAVPTSDLKFVIKGQEGIDGFWAVNADCNKINFKEGAGSELTATVASGLYTAAQYAAAIQAALNAAPGRALTYTCTYSDKTSKFTISATGTFSLLWETGTNADIDISDLAGYDDSEDDTGAATYTADDSVTPSYDEVEYIAHGSSLDLYVYENLRDTAAHTRIGQSFTVGTVGFYVSSIKIYWMWQGTPVEGTTLGVGVYSAVSPETRLGALSAIEEVETSIDTWTPVLSGGTEIAFSDPGSSSGIECDVLAPGTLLETGGTILNSLIVDILKKSATGGIADLLDSTALAAFEAARDETIAVYLDEADTTFESVLGKIETSLMFKLLPLNDDTYAPMIFTSADPETGGQTLHLHDAELQSGFSMTLDNSAVYKTVSVSYATKADIGTTKSEAVDSDVAAFFYDSVEKLEIETYLTGAADALKYAGWYSGLYEAPPLTVTFELHGKGLTLIPGRDKVKLWRERAAYTGGALAGVLFRVTKVVASPGSLNCKITAQLDTQTYPAGA